MNGELVHGFCKIKIPLSWKGYFKNKASINWKIRLSSNLGKDDSNIFLDV